MSLGTLILLTHIETFDVGPSWHASCTMSRETDLAGLGIRLGQFWQIKPKTLFLRSVSKHDDPNVVLDFLDARNLIVESIAHVDTFFFCC